jgi:NAD(P)-dependent dehydrogenase (short-subunit alcohol dehydrogenase family)
MRDKVCLVTGATSGIGLVTARELVRRGARVVVVGRDPARCENAVRKIADATGGRQAETLLADLSSQRQVRELARQFRERHGRLDVLVNNAGGLWLERRLTEDGLEMTFAVNHLAYFRLTHLLLDTLKASAASRVVNVASAAHRGATLDFNDLQGERGYSGWQAYCRSKLANILFTYELARRLQTTGVTANALHPGWVATGFGGGNGWRGRLLRGVAALFALGEEAGARTSVYLATSPEVEGVTGRYFDRERPVASSPASLDEDAARRLWRVSEELTGVAAAV